MATYQVKHQPKSVVEVTLNITKEDIDKAYAKARARAAGKVQIPGFRKGKAPEPMVESYIGKEKIYEDALNTVIPEEFENALKEDQSQSKERTVVLEYPAFKLAQDWKPGDDLSVTATCSIYPRFSIESLDKELKVPKGEPDQTTDEEVQESVDKIFEQYKKIKQKDQDQKVISEEDKTTPEAETNVQPVPDTIEMNDEFAKAAGAKDMEELRSMVRSEIEYDKRMKFERDFEEQVVKKAVDLIEIDIPDILINEELNRIEQRFTSQLNRIGTTLDKYLETESKTLEQMRAEWRERAVENTKLALILQEVRVKKEIPVSEQEVKILAAQNGIRDQISQDQFATLSYMIGQSKALESLKASAVE